MPRVDEQVRQVAAVNFKYHLLGRWAPTTSPKEANAGLVPSPIAEFEKEQMKALIVSLILSVTPRIQSQVSKSLAVIGKHGIANSIFKKFRFHYKPNDILLDLKYLFVIIVLPAP